VVVRAFFGTAAAAALFALSGSLAALADAPQPATTSGPSCGQRLFTNPQGLQIQVLWAKNGAVQRFVVIDSKENPEAINDMKKDLQRTYGPEGVNAPPLRIASFRPGQNGMMIPDKAVDSCGRTLSFQ
jgi:hypothetical protein